MADDLEARLRSHAEAFEGLLSLIPAERYYAPDTSDQWQRKKQTKEQKRQAKKAVLNPENHKSAKDVIDENERKRKRELELEGQETSDHDPANTEKPREGLKAAAPKAKKQKLDRHQDIKKEEPSNDSSVAEESIEASHRKSKADKRKEKQDQKKAKVERKMAAKEAKKTPQQVHDFSDAEPAVDDVPQDQWEDVDEMEAVDVSGLDQENKPQLAQPTGEESTASPSATSGSPLSVASIQPSTSSTSSIIPLTSTDGAESSQPTKPSKIKLPDVDHDVLAARLRAKIEALRAARKADGIDGKPARTRQELMEARRLKAQQRKQHKKELRQQAKTKEQEQREKTEAELARLRGSGSPDLFSPRIRSPPEANNYSFGRVAFDDGQTLDASLSGLRDPHKKKGPQDPKTALQAAKKKQQRLAALDDEKRADIESKDAWLNAKKRVHGERVRDDTNLLKKALKRKEKQKGKSEREWDERINGVEKGKEARQRKREANLQKRREEKNAPKGKGAKPKGVAKKKKGRPGFEGRFGLGSRK